jgi:hypothetical protein
MNKQIDILETYDYIVVKRDTLHYGELLVDLHSN